MVLRGPTYYRHRHLDCTVLYCTVLYCVTRNRHSATDEMWKRKKQIQRGVVSIHYKLIITLLYI